MVRMSCFVGSKIQNSKMFFSTVRYDKEKQQIFRFDLKPANLLKSHDEKTKLMHIYFISTSVCDLTDFLGKLTIFAVKMYFLSFVKVFLLSNILNLQFMISIFQV